MNPKERLTYGEIQILAVIKALFYLSEGVAKNGYSDAVRGAYKQAHRVISIILNKERRAARLEAKMEKKAKEGAVSRAKTVEDNVPKVVSE